MKKKNISLIAIALVIAATSLLNVSCSKEFQVEKNQLYGTWYFPSTLAPDTLTGFNWAAASMTIKAPDTMLVNAEPGKVFIWTLRDNNVTATCTPRANVDEHYVIAFTVNEIDAKTMKIVGKYRYLYMGDNQVWGNISCTLSKTPPAK